MKTSKFTDSQIISILKANEAGVKVSDNYCRLTSGLLSAVICLEDALKLKEIGVTIGHGSL